MGLLVVPSVAGDSCRNAPLYTDDRTGRSPAVAVDQRFGPDRGQVALYLEFRTSALSLPHKTSGEQEGVRMLYRVAMQFIRNPVMDKLIEYRESTASLFVRIVDSLLQLLSEAEQ